MAPKKELIAVRNVVISRIRETYELAQAAAADASKISFFKIKYKLLQGAIDQFNSVHIQIISSVPDSELAEQDEIRKEIDDLFIQIESEYEKCCPVLHEEKTSPPASPELIAFNTSPHVKLPKLELVKFSGDLKTWQTFIDIFDSSVHNSVYISDIDKFQYLLASLVNEPLTVVKAIPLTAANYQIAYDALVKRYSNKRLLTLHHWRALKNYPPVNSDNYKMIRQLVDTFSENLAVLEHLGCNVKDWDFVLTDLLLDKLDASTRRRFELSSDAALIPKFDELKDFLVKQCVALEAASTATVTSSKTKLNSPVNSRSFRSPNATHSRAFVVNTQRGNSPTVEQVSMISCPICKMNHPIYRCSSFLAKTPHDRFQAAKHAQLCVNCLKPNHTVVRCSSHNTCRSCNAKHHSLLHFPVTASANSGNQNRDTPQPTTTRLTSAGVNSCTSVSCNKNDNLTNVLLATVSFEINDKYGNFSRIRALLDPGSQATFIVESAAKQLGLRRSKNSFPIFGLGQTVANCAGDVTHCQIRPSGSQQPPLDVEAIVIKTICSDLPSSSVNLSHMDHLRNLPLADPLYHTPGNIQMLLGADIYPSIVTGSTIVNDTTRGPMAIETIFGWAILGPINHSIQPKCHSFCVAVESCLDSSLTKFWEVEEVPSVRASSVEDTIVENHFQKSHFRTPSGRFGVALPFRVDSPHFENSCRVADRRLLSLEKRLQVQPLVRNLYVDFMQNYLSSGHMTLHSQVMGDDAYYIPHHGVFNPNGDHQKIRVVFDASAKAANELSLNDTLYPGPKLQSDISAILLRFRVHNVVFTCDIRQMYRQILVQDEDRKYQLIRWRFNVADPIETYQLNTITYGINCSPYLAIRTLHQLADDGSQQFPLASQSLRRDIYVDDLVCGASSLENALSLRDQLIALLESGCFELRKWSSNHPLLLQDIPSSHRQPNLDFDSTSNSDSTLKILGLQWSSVTDSFLFKVRIRDSPCTKRSILSEVARIYDPLGFLSPLTLLAKRIIQYLWTLGLGWDDTPPEDVRKIWLQYKSQVSCLGSLRIPRYVAETPCHSCQLHAFCDASEAGYACVIYFRITDQHDNVSMRFIMAKSKVTPLKRLSIPRLELCASVLLSKLVKFVLEIYEPYITFDRIVAWSDSTVSLTWIRSSPHKWKSFVANRVTYIQERLPPSCWHYVPSKDNPADPASRGLLPEEVLSCSLWWAGPSFLYESPESWPGETIQSCPNTDIDSEKKVVSLVAQHTPSYITNLLTAFSSLCKIQRIIAYVLRFIDRMRDSIRYTGSLTSDELHRALLHIVKAVQSESFSQEISAVLQRRKCPKYLQKLSPFVDKSGILRVGGRLAYSNLSFETKHPALLPRNHRLTELLIKQVHEDNFHPGINTTLYLLQRNFWILSQRRAIRYYLSHCNRCFRVNPIAYPPPMGDLPETRISRAKPFSCVGVDYAGPFIITFRKTRGAKTQKAYLCLFICFTTKAVHLELASDLSTETFLAALRRFIARRGRCSRIFSDCGSNFIGANRELVKNMQASAEAERITWTFNPPSAPHFGGLWESGVKSVKTHLKRVIGNQILTYEELATLFAQIEALLNSRPLCSLSSDPNDLSVLTPGHFLTLEPLASVPDPDLSHLSINRLSRWQLIQHMHQSFWVRWKNEYLHNLYQRSKWSKSHLFKPVNIGQLVLIKDELLPPLQWKMGRIVELHPGKDGVARVASVRTTLGTFKRPVVKLCALPSQ